MSKFSLEDLKSIRDSTKVELNSRFGTDYAAQLSYLFEKISMPDSGSSVAGQVERAVLGNFALHIHRRHGGLSKQQVQSLREMVTLALKSAQVDQRKSLFAFLYRDMHTVMSQLLRDEGNHWEALCEQVLAVDYSSDEANFEDRMPGYSDLALAMRLTRLGHLARGKAHFEQALSSGLRTPDNELARLMLAKIRRWCGDFSGSSSDVAELMAAASTDDMRFECLWDSVLCQPSLDERLAGMKKVLKAVQTSVDATSYLLEHQLWIHSAWQRTFPREARRVKNLKRSVSTRMRSKKILVDLLDQIELSYDRDVSVQARTLVIAKAATQTGLLPSLEMEAVALVSLARCAERLKNTALKNALADQYLFLSRKILPNERSDFLSLGM